MVTKADNIGLFVADHIEAMLAYWDKNQVCRFANNAYLSWFGKSRDEMVDKITMKELLGILYEKNLPYIIGALNGKVQQFEREIKTPTNGIRHSIANYYPDIENGEVKGFIVHVADITLQKENEKKIRQFAAIVDSTLDAIISKNFDEEILTWNSGAEKIFGYKIEEIQGKYAHLLTPAHLIEEEKKIIKKVIAGESIGQYETLRLRKDGVTINVAITFSHIKDSNGNIVAISEIIRDITVNKAIQVELEQAKKKADESIILKEAFLANMSHEIRTPMNAIVGFTNLLLKKNLQTQEIEYIRIIKNSGENLLRIINDILDVSKIDSGMMEFEEHLISIKEIFSSLQIMLSQNAQEKKFSLSFECHSNIPDTVLGDPTRLTQIILNLTGNSVKFTKVGGVHVFAEVVSENKERFEIKFSVKDTGIGIPEDKLSSIFERFSQAEVHTTRKYGGTGLGLSIAKQLVEMQGGEMTVKSTIDIGSVFSFILPFKKTDQTYTAKVINHEKLDMERLSKLTVLVVEDNTINIKFMSGLFEEYGIIADMAENGKVALEKVKHNSYDLILMDIEMPEMNGYEATDAIRNDLKKDVQIIAMTAHAMAGEKEKCLLMGMNDYISKPINSDLLFEKMLDAISGKQLVKEHSIQQKKMINLDFLIKTLRGNKKVILQTIDIFLRQVPNDLTAFNEAIEQKDYPSIKIYSHKMKSTISLSGIYHLVPVLNELEELGTENGDIGKIKELSIQVNESCEQALKEMEQERLNYT